jgi:hypothetical protein
MLKPGGAWWHDGDCGAFCALGAVVPVPFAACVGLACVLPGFFFGVFAYCAGFFPPVVEAFTVWTMFCAARAAAITPISTTDRLTSVASMIDLIVGLGVAFLAAFADLVSSS